MRFINFILLIALFSSCEVKVKSAEENSSSKTKTYSRNEKKIRNGIEFETKGGVKVEQAFLTYDDDGSLVDEQNITDLKRKIKLNLIVNGWQAENDRVYIEASEKILTGNGDEIADMKNLFSESNVESVSIKDSKFLSLDVVINKVDRIDYFLVEFSVWNKKADQSVKGHYKFYLNNM